MVPAIARHTALLVCTVVAAAQQPAPRLAASRPNILFVFSDDHAAHAISAYGSTIATTPNIDRIARTGALFSANFCGNSICGPSRATVLTGLHSHANGFMRNGNVFDGAQPTFPRLLQQAGYQTAIVGKWHLESTPTGFDHWAVLPGQGQYYEPDFLTAAGRVRMHGHVTDVTTQLAIDWLEQRDPDRPFLLMCQHKAPHRPWQPATEDLALFADTTIAEPPTLFDDYDGRAEPARHTEMQIDRDLTLHYDLMLAPTDAERPALRDPDTAYDGMMARMTAAHRARWDAAFARENAAFRADPPTGRELVRWKYQRYIKNYLRCIAGVDRSIGHLLDWLRAHPDVEANTVVVYASDQGFCLGDHGCYYKRWMYEPSLRMPLLMAWPGHITAGRTIAQLTQNIDFAPTFLELAGAPIPEAVHGRSLVPLLAGDAPPPWRDAVYYHYYESLVTHRVPAHFGVRTERYKLIRYYEPHWDVWELFDLQTDPQELHSVAGAPAYAEVRAALTRRLATLREQYGDSTGQLGDGAFPITAGIARAQRTEGGWRVWANTGGGYLLRPGARPGRTVFATTLRPLPHRPGMNGCLVASGGDPRAELVRIGIAFGARRLTISPVGSLQPSAESPLEWDGQGALPLRVTMDLDRHVVRAEAGGAHVEAALPADWTTLTAWGYGASNAECEFSDLVIE